jgi:hypothetical protein
VDHPSNWRLLIMDNHRSHDSDEFRRLAFANRVQPYYLPNNTSHELQPLDVGCFSPLKTKYRQQIEDLAILDISAARSKRRFVRAYEEASKETFTKEIIRNSFRHSSIWPLRPEYVIQRLKPPSPPSRPSTPPSSLKSPEVPLYITPRNAAQLRDQVMGVLDELEGVTRKHQLLARGWAKAFDKLAVESTTKTVENARLGAEAEANKQLRRRRVRPREGELFVTPEQILEEREVQGQPQLKRRKRAAPQQSIANATE